MTKLKAIYLGDLRTRCVHESGAEIATDAPRDNPAAYQGRGEYFSPTDLFAVSLGSCMLTLMGVAAHQLGLDLKGATAEVEKEMSLHPLRRIGKMIVRIHSKLSPTPEEMKKMEQMAIQCPIHASIHPDIRLEIDFVWGCS
jgi:uncharacterized OsmC-like protein